MSRFITYAAADFSRTASDDTSVWYSDGAPEARGRYCLYCRQLVSFVTVAKLRDVWDADHWIDLNRCQCGWWRLDHTHDDRFHETIYRNHVFGAIKEYAVDALDVPIAALRDFLVRNPKSLANVNPRTFELLMQDCLKSEYGNCEVVHVGGTADGGIDLKLILSAAETYLIQVKRRSDLWRNETVRVVRELNGVLFREGIPKGMVITTARGYTAAALREFKVKTLTSEAYVVELRSLKDVLAMLRLPSRNPYKPWRAHMVNLEKAGFTLVSAEW